MKTFYTLLLIAFAASVHSQSIQPEIAYRVVAVQHTAPQIESQSNEVELGLGLALFMPTAFTPNNDGLNDTFGAVGQGIEQFHLVVFDRWGNQVFESNDSNSRWDGMFRGKTLPEGAYSYSATAQNRFQEPIVKIGSVMLLH